MWPSSARPSGTLLQRLWPALVQVRCVRSNSPVLRLASARCSLANSHRSQILSGRCVRSKFGAPPALWPALLCGAAVFECFRRRARRRWATPRHPVRRSRPDTSCLLTRADRRLLCTSQDRSRDVLQLWPRSLRLRTSTAREAHEHVRLVAPAWRSEDRGRAVGAMCSPGHGSCYFDR